MRSDVIESGFPTSSMAEWVLQQLRILAAEKGKVAQIFGDDNSSWTYEKLLDNSVKVAAGLNGFGINSGDMMSFVTRNCHELYAIVLGCLMSGITVTPSIAELPPRELRQNFLLVQPKFVITGQPSIAAVNEAVNDASPGFHSKPEVFEIKQFFKEVIAKGAYANPATFQPAHTTDPKTHVFSCMFSSGTTGKQKAVAMTDYGFLRAMYVASRFTKIGDGPAFNISQANWISWWFIVVRSFFLGWTRIFLDKVDIVNVLDVIHKQKPSVMFGSPRTLGSMAHELKENPGRWNVSPLVAVFLGGDIVNKFEHERLSKILKTNLYQEYGSTEAGIVLQNRQDTPVVYGSCGKPLMPLKLVDVTTGKEIHEPNQPGEVVVKWLVLHSYVNNPEATADTLDGNNWLKMGDIAEFDEFGNFFIVDRVKEMFKYCGFQIAPSELEDIIKKIPGVKEVGVAGKDAGLEIGCFPTALVVMAAGSNITEKDIQDYLAKENLHDSKRLRGGVIFVQSIPRNVNGKIIRARLKEMVNQF